METIWLSPAEYVTGDPSLRISHPFVGHPNTVVTCTEAGDFKWISMGLRLPPSVRIEEVIICYQVSNSESYISQIRLSEMDTPDQARVSHDDATDLKSINSVCYTSRVDGVVPSPGTAVTLALRLNFQIIRDDEDKPVEIRLGAVGVKVQSTQPACLDTIADLRALAPGAAACATVLGYHSPNDGGGGSFSWDPGETANDGGLFFRPEGFAGAGRWVRLTSGQAVNIRWFGAKGDGHTNDAPTIQNALNACRGKDAYFCTVYFPGGIYKVKGPLVVRPSVHVYGDGIGCTVVEALPPEDGEFEYPNTSVFNFRGGGLVEIGGLFDEKVFEHDSVINITFDSTGALKAGDILVVHDPHQHLMVDRDGEDLFAPGDMIIGENRDGYTPRGEVVRWDPGNKTIVFSYVRDDAGNLPSDHRPFEPHGEGIQGDPEDICVSTARGENAFRARSAFAGGSYNVARPSYNAGEFLYVSHVEDAVSPYKVHLYGGLQAAYYQSDVRIWKMINPTMSSIHDMTIRGDGSPGLYPFCLSFHIGRNVSAYNLRLENSAYSCFELDRCFGALCHNIHLDQDADPLIDSDCGVLSGAGIGCTNSQDVQITDCRINATRHAVASGQYSYEATLLPNPVNRHIVVDNCELRTRGLLALPGEECNGAVQATGDHGNTERCVYSNNRIYGGVIVAGRLARIIGNQIYGVAIHPRSRGQQPSVAIWPGELKTTEFEIIDNYIQAPGTFDTRQYGAISLMVKPYTKPTGPTRIVGNRIVLVREIGDEPMAIYIGTDFRHLTNTDFRNWRLVIEQNDIDAGQGIGLSAASVATDFAEIYYRYNYLYNYREAIDVNAALLCPPGDIGVRPGGVDRAGNVFGG